MLGIVDDIRKVLQKNFGWLEQRVKASHFFYHQIRFCHIMDSGY